MTNFEFDDLLERVADVIASEEDAAVDVDTSFAAMVLHLPLPANDNAAAWPLLEFPAGWTASC
jgi:hypothetical protein